MQNPLPEHFEKHHRFTIFRSDFRASIVASRENDTDFDPFALHVCDVAISTIALSLKLQ
jgi:hypothetical protein